MTVDLAIVDGNVVSGDSTTPTHLLVDQGRIVAQLPHGNTPDARRVISAAGHFVLPGLVDAHVHFREPGAAHKEGFESGTQAAAVGGVTTVMVMPTDDPLTLTPEDYEEKIRLAEDRSHVDHAILAQLGPDFSAIDALADLGVISFEVFLSGQAPQGMLSDNHQLVSAMERVGYRDRVLGVSPGDDSITNARSVTLRACGRKDPLAFAASRPPISEALGVARACLTAVQSGCRVHVRQVSCQHSVALLRLWREQARNLTAEVMPHNLLLLEDDLVRQGPFAKMAPPLREDEDRQALWTGLLDGSIDIIATDHAPHLPVEKECGLEDIWLAPLGVPGLQTWLPLLLGEAAAGRLSYQQIIRFTSEVPARIFGLYPRKGSLVPGADADIVIVDPNREWIIKNEQQLSKAKVTPFDGWTVRGAPLMTLLRGVVVMEAGRIVGPPRGRLVAH